MADVGDILNDDDFFGDIVDTPKEGIQQHKKWECLKSVIDKGKAHLLGHKWTYGRVDKASDKVINKTYAEYRQRELNEKGENTGKTLGKHIINLYSDYLALVLIAAYTASNVDFGGETEDEDHESEGP